jgi:hypothetical protein
VRYGEPFLPSEGSAEEATAELMDRIRGLLAESQASHPQPPGPAPGDDWWIPAHLGGSAPTPEEAEARIVAQMAERRARRDREHGADTGRGREDGRDAGPDAAAS